MRIVIVGPGALGCLLGGLLSKKAEVWLLDRDPQRAERIIRNQGISSQGVSGSWQAKIPATARPEDIGDADLVVICTKAYHTKDAIVQAKSLVKKNTAVLTLQNGLGNAEVIAEVVGETNVLVGSTQQAVTLLREAHIEHVAKGETVIGHLAGKVPVSLRQVREVFNKAGIEARISMNIQGVLWSKLVINAGINALTAVTRLRNGELTRSEHTAQLLRAAVNEAVRVAKRKRIKLLFDDPVTKVEAVCEATAANVSSMLQDVLARRQTEIDFINGAIIRQGNSSGIPVPVNTTLYQLVKAVESSYQQEVPRPQNPS
ncbi:MAG: 2-dehydropantoate 2-reductase [Candidatus Omnitrophota bacterium]|nr:2-dehydropantoate 2-reductase [Candidatus Omnitrophota bacterium]MDZ4243047.1 2-dehydropantoate 2-reductase [Candidatus Omnitrophota bacterium]